LRNSGIDILKLTTFLWYCIDRALQPDKRKKSFEIALSATDLYFTLSFIKSAKLYRLFNVNIFQKCIDLLKNAERFIRPLASKTAKLLQPKRRGAANEPEKNDPLGIENDTEHFVSLIENTMRSLFVAFHSRKLKF
jgi:hypothetical protein